MKVLIKPGATIFHDMGIFRWPYCKPKGYPTIRIAIINTVFETVEESILRNSETIKVVAAGFGAPPEYVNGEIIVKKADLIPFESLMGRLEERLGEEDGDDMLLDELRKVLK